MSINFINSMGLILISLIIGYFIVKMYDYIRYSEELKFIKRIEKIRNQKCMKEIENYNYIKLLQQEQLLLDELVKYLKCNKLRFFLNDSLKSIFCIKHEGNIKYLHKLTYFLGKHYCTNDVFALYNFLEQKYTIYLKHNTEISPSELNIILFGVNNLEEDTVIDLLLEMKLIEFLKKFSILNSLQ